MNEIDFSNNFLAKDRGYDLLLIIFPEYTNYSSILNLYKDGSIKIEKASSLNDIVTYINLHMFKRVLIASAPNFDYNFIDIDSIIVPDCRIFFLSNKNSHTKINISTDKYVSINLSESVDDYFFNNSILQLNNLNDKLAIGISSTHGFGVFSTKCFIKGDVLFKLFGTKVYLKENLLFSYEGEWNALRKDLLLCREHRTTYGFINHSKNPNCYFDSNELTVKVLKNINSKDEIFLDYTKEPLPLKYLNKHSSTYL